MKICFFVSDITKIGGIERVISTLVTQLIKYEDLNIEIVSMFKGRGKPNYEFPDKLQIIYLNNKPHEGKPHSIKRLAIMLSSIASVKAFFSKSKYDFVLAQSFPIAMVLYVCGYSSNKIIAVEHVYAGYYGSVAQKIRKYIYSRIKKVVVLTTDDKCFFDKQLPNELTYVIPNPVRKIKFINASLENKKVISVGRLEYQKGYDNLIICFNEIHKKYPDWKLDIWGDGSLRNELQSSIDRVGLNGIITLCGHSNDIDSKLNDASIFVLSSRFEGFPMVLVEAMSHGIPCISFNCPNGPSDIIKNGENGIIVENQNLSELVIAIESLIENENERKRLGNNAPNSVQHFSEEIIAQKWYKLLKSII